MKPFVVCLALPFFLMMMVQPFVMAQSRDFIIKGYVKDMKDQLLRLHYVGDIGHIIDTTTSRRGTFFFKGTVAEPVRAELITSSGHRIKLYLEGGEVIVRGAAENNNTIIAQGGVIQNQYRALQLQLIPFYKDSANRGGVFEQRVSTGIAAVVKVFIREHPASIVSLDELISPSDERSSITGDEKLQLLQGLDSSLRRLARWAVIYDRTLILKRNAIGQHMTDFTMADTSGKPLKLSNFKGKYLLLDFWASWCGPCRNENNVLVDTYNKYKGKGFEILSVSLDYDKTKWMDAIEADNLTWTQVSDLRGTDNEAAHLYNIYEIPQNVLFDPEGRIVARNLQGSALNMKLKELIHNR
ncbi:MAG TPA: TlpA disulfide reductase family protein [Chitinophaga sp.]|uniref:TlpA disulfide reductase family protein n=1 Tax=Chitinophaga sp. TaxID=1869181 RepID=UPI002B8555A7|nr:TlpA disulfide reductase family protein [Chitinophaga sp.]HVI48450.1 TlpA disulfide reductase family protein [Chitinophaga sp.]